MTHISGIIRIIIQKNTFVQVKFVWFIFTQKLSFFISFFGGEQLPPALHSARARSSQQSCSIKKELLNILQNSQENICARDSFLIKKNIKKRVIIKKLCKIFKNTFFTEYLWTTTSVVRQWHQRK